MRRSQIKVWRRITDGLLLGAIRHRHVIYAGPHNIHPNGDDTVVVRMDVQHFENLLNHARQHTLALHGIDFIECACGMQTDEEIILDLMRNHYQRVQGTKCRVHFYVRDVGKELDIRNST